MSHTDRDRRGRPHSGKNCPESAAGGCVYCITGEYKQPARRSARQREHDEIRTGLAEALGEGNGEHSYDEHVFVAGRCVRCRTDWIDASVYDGLEVCPGKDGDTPIVYTTSTGGKPSSSHRID